MSALFEILSKVELLIHFASTLVKHSKDLKDALDGLEIAHEEDEHATDVEDAEGVEDIEEGQEESRGRPLKKRKGYRQEGDQEE